MDSRDLVKGLDLLIAKQGELLDEKDRDIKLLKRELVKALQELVDVRKENTELAEKNARLCMWLRVAIKDSQRSAG